MLTGEENGSSAPRHATRRQFVKTAAAGLVAAAAPTSSKALAAAPDLSKLPYIDAHSHVWSPDTDRWPLANGQTRADLKPSSFTPEELFALAEPERVGRVVLIQHTVYHGFDN